MLSGAEEGAQGAPFESYKLAAVRLAEAVRLASRGNDSENDLVLELSGTVNRFLREASASFSAVVTSGSSVSRGKERAPPSRSQCLFCYLSLLSLWVGKFWMQGGSGKRGSRTGHWQPPVAGARPEAACGLSCS